MIVIVNYRMGNLRSVAKAFEVMGAEVLVSDKIRDLRQARAIVLPGVGAFGQGMKHLRELGIIPVLKEEINKGKPFLGICLGLQLLFTYSEEHGIHRGLNIIAGKVKSFPKRLKVPHMGWNQVKIQNSKFKIRNLIFAGIPDNSYFYFLHSYYVVPEDKRIILATTDYGVKFASLIQKDNIFGVQFHPEKSQELGLKILKNFLVLSSKYNYVGEKNYTLSGC
ncbi:MAG: imidazole glycerol phosphate synthase subunit HisH [Candidatus Omnitrophica bacterium]|nr:imidazole glycerol phosphate synthase subunit HisH [Candidatus Omnitrophota bacterium]MCM8798551.1 imidazole glycerol phosphate synthase subunit HisH [Candidatus Omnitrophota bacterium]